MMSSDNDDNELKEESAAQISSNIMLRVPTIHLAELREMFESQEHGLNIVQFLRAFARCMELDSDYALLKTIPDLLDFFNLVDVNGDGHMEWTEFVMFLIEQVVNSSHESKIYEKLKYIGDKIIQPTSCRRPTQSSIYLKDFNKMFVGCNSEIQIFTADDKASNWLTKSLSMPLQPKSIGKKKSKKDDDKPKETSDEPKIPIDVIDLQYHGVKDILCVLRSDLCIEFYKFMSRQKLLSETIYYQGTFNLPAPYSKIQLRIMPKETWKLFAIACTTHVIDCWDFNVGISGNVELANHKTLEKHTDLIRDILVINTDIYSILVSCGMDRKVHIWDLVTLKYKTTRTGHTAGVRCLAFDGRSVLLAGGYDYKIIGWDLDAEIDRPLFNLWGHNADIVQIVAIGAVDRCFSLDSNGEIRVWDTNKSNPNDKEERQIDCISCLEDHIMCFDVYPNLSVERFHAVHGLMINAHGRRQHSYKVKDVTPKEGMPLKVLYSAKLLMIIGMYAKDILFWSAVSGDEQKKMEDVGGHGIDCTAAVLDDREAKLIIGDSSGIVSIYNCVNGVKLKQFPSTKLAIRFILYTPDKTVIVVSGSGDLCIFDELPNDPDANFRLRETKAHESDIVSIAYSHKLGLIATADSSGLVCLWNYEFLSLETMIPKCTGTDIGQICFIDPFPLLLVTDSIGNYTIIPCGSAAAYYKNKLWRVETVVCSKNESLDIDARLGNHDDKEKEEETLTKAQVIDSSTVSIVEGEDGVVEESSTTKSEQKSIVIEEEEEEDELSAFLSHREMNEYLMERREVKCIAVHVKSKTMTTAVSKDDPVAKALKILKDMRRAEQKRRKLEDSSIKVESDDEEDFDFSDDDVDTKKQVKKDPFAVAEAVKPPSFPSDTEAFVIVGNDDGSVCIVDITQALIDINIGMLPVSEDASKKLGFEPRRKAKRIVQSWDISRAMWSEESIVENESFVACKLMKVWYAGKGAITTLTLVEDCHDIITSASDDSIMLWTLQGNQKGVLTRGREFDKLFKPRWRTPIDMITRASIRMNQAEILVKEVQLERRIDVIDDSNAKTSGSATIEVHTFNMTSESELIHSRKTEHDHHEGSKSVFSAEEEEISRVLGQMHGKITYVQSSKEAASQALLEKHAKAMSAFRSIGSDIKKKKPRKLNPFRWQAPTYVVNPDDMFSNPKYMKEIMHDPRQMIINEKQDEDTGEKKERRIKTKYDVELATIDLKDPHNWAIHSENRQRALYEHLYFELDKAGLTKDVMALYSVKLNNLCPNKSFQDFIETVVNKRKLKKSMSKSLSNTTIELTEMEKSLSLDLSKLHEQAKPKMPKNNNEITPLAPLKKLAKVATGQAPETSLSITSSISHKKEKDEFYEDHKYLESCAAKFEANLEKAEKYYRIAERQLRKAKREKKLESTHSTNSKGHPISLQMTANLLLTKASSLNDLIEIGKKQQSAELNWVRKISFVQSNKDLEIRKVKRKEKVEVKQETEKPKGSREQAELKLLARKTFGPYQAAELLNFFNVFESFAPKEEVKDIVIHEDDLQEGDEVTPLVAPTPEQNYILKSELMIAKLQPLLGHNYLRMRPQFKAELDRVMSSKCSDGTLSHNVEISLYDALGEMCPYLSQADRKNCIRYCFLKSKKEVTVTVVKAKELSAEDMQQLRAMFNFFDKDRSGDVSRDEILAALETTSKNKKQHSQFDGDDGGAPQQPGGLGSMINEDMIIDMMKSVDGDGNAELDFDEFVQLFKNILL